MNIRFFSSGLILLLAALALLVGCAKSSDNVTASYVSPVTYKNYSCRELGAEARRVSAEAAKLAGVQDTNATNDAIATTVGVIVFWPALFLIEGNGETAAQLSRLKGQVQAIEKVAIRRKCRIKFRKTKRKKKSEENA